ncbi:MAG: hypothetical protein Q9195_001065 [Heterodermia aff. obscurata]
MSTLPPLPSTFPHADPLLTLLPHLLPLLPSSLPLVRRLQFHFSSIHATALATFPASLASASKIESFAACWFGKSSQSVEFSTQPPSYQRSVKSTDPINFYQKKHPISRNVFPTAEPLMLTSIDRTRRPETECWIFSTHEIANKKPTANNTLQSEPNQHKIHDASTARSQLLALLLAIAETASPLSTAESQSILVLGSVHISLLHLLAGDEPLPEGGSLRSPQRSQSRGKTDGTSVLVGASSGYLKWLILPSRPEETEARKAEFTLPPGYSFSALQPGELARVVSSTSIPRTEATLATLGSVCVRDSSGGVVSWGFLGVDGSLSSLYTEEGHRGKGLAKAVARRLVAGVDGGEGDGVRMGYRGVGEGEGWVHSDIDVENRGSAAVARAIGGTVGWECRWVGVDLGRVREVVSRLCGGGRGLAESGQS